MTCPALEHWPDGCSTCRVATLLAQRENTDRHCKVTPEACAVCESLENSRQTNRVTLSLAYSTLFRDGELDTKGKHSYLTKAMLEGIPKDGPGTRLQKRLAWFVFPDTKCDCENHAKMMDMMGIHGCRQNIDVILGWLEASSKKQGLVFLRFIAKRFVEAAIDEYESFIKSKQLPIA